MAKVKLRTTTEGKNNLSLNMELYLWNFKGNLAKRVKPNQGRGISFSLVSRQFYSCQFSSNVRSKPIPRISLQTSPLMDFAPQSSHHSWEGTSWEENQCILYSSFAFFRKRTGDPKDRIRSSFSLFTANNFQLCTEFGGYLCVHILQPELFLKGWVFSGSFSLPFPLYICSHSSEEHGNASRDPPHSLNGDKRTFLEKSNCLKVVHMPL